MSKDIILSLHPKWFKPIMDGRKIYEVRKRAPLQTGPFKVYLYCTKGEEAWLTKIIGKQESYQLNSTVCGEFTCRYIVDRRPPFFGENRGTCLTAKELYEYMGSNDHLCYLNISNPIMYDKPKSLEDFGLTRPPQSWCYVKD